MRPGIQALMEGARDGKFDLIMAESLDRISRDQEDIAGVYKRMRFAGVDILTLSEGPINELHIGLKGTMGALYLKDLAPEKRRTPVSIDEDYFEIDVTASVDIAGMTRMFVRDWIRRVEDLSSDSIRQASLGLEPSAR